jgi:hypothetical protein
MPQLSFAVSRAGLLVPTWIGLDGTTTSVLHTANKPIPAPIQVRGLLDTASDATAVASWVLQQLRIPAATTAVTQTAAGQAKVKLYEISLSINDPGLGKIMLTKSDLLITELPATLPDTDVLIGLDVLLDCKLFLDGPSRQFSLDF